MTTYRCVHWNFFLKRSKDDSILTDFIKNNYFFVPKTDPVQSSF